MSQENYRLYSFVAGLYLSPLQCGLQTAHVVSEIVVGLRSRQDGAFMEWAAKDKTIIICDAGNHKGVLDCWAELKRTGVDTGLMCGAIFHEDEQSMNGMAAACGVIVPQKYWDTKFVPEERTFYQPEAIGARPYTSIQEAYWSYTDVEGRETRYPLTHPEGQFIDRIKKYRLA